MDAVRTPDLAADDGFTLVESMVTIVLITVAVFALLGELTAYIRQQANDRARASAVRLMTSSVEGARSLSLNDLTGLVGTTTVPVVDHGRHYTTSTTVQHCSLTDAVGTCTTPTTSAQDDVRVLVSVSWQDGTKTRTVSTGTTVSDRSEALYRPSGTGTISGLVGGASSSAAVASVSAFGSSPSSVTVNPSGQPTELPTLTLTTVGLTVDTTSIPVTWTDDAGSHQMALTGGPSIWSGAVPSLTAAVPSGHASTSVVFAATVPGSQGLVTATTTVVPAADFTACSVSPAPVVLKVLTRRTNAAETLTCTTTGLSGADAVSVSYPSGATTATAALATSNGGSTWTLVLPANTSLANGVALTEAFSFALTRASDGAYAVRNVTAVLL